MDSYKDFTLFSNSTPSTLRGSPLFPSQPSAPLRQPVLAGKIIVLTPVQVLYIRICAHLSASIFSAASVFGRTTAEYKQWCCAADSYLNVFSTSHHPMETSLKRAYFEYHRRNMEKAVREAEMEVKRRQEVLTAFSWWVHDSKQRVDEGCLNEYWQRLMGVAPEEQELPARGQEVRQEEEEEEQEEEEQEEEEEDSEEEEDPEQAWGPWTQKIGAGFESAPLNHSALLADLHRPDRDTITSQEAETTWERINSWRHSTPPYSGALSPPEIDEIPLYDSPISDEMIERQYSGEYTPGMDFDVWLERHLDLWEEEEEEGEMERYFEDRVEGCWLGD